MGAELLSRMPEAARRDVFEWPFEPTAEQEFDYVLKREISMSQLMTADPNTQAMHDDHPVNEYVLLRKLEGNKFKPGSLVAWYEHTKTP
jgi:hypothetical protein